MTLTTRRSRSPRPLFGGAARGLAGALAFAALVVLVLGTGACASTSPAAKKVDDAALTAKVKTKITADPELNPFKIDVDTLDGVVTLRGTVSTEEKSAEAAKLARMTEGVINVTNRLNVHRGAMAKDRVGDAALASEVSADLSADPDVSAHKIDVDVKDGVVTLSGMVNSDFARRHAEEVAHKVDGVRRVINELRVA